MWKQFYIFFIRFLKKTQKIHLIYYSKDVTQWCVLFTCEIPHLILLFLKNVSTSKNFHLQGGRFFSWNFQIALDKAVFCKIVRTKNEGCWSKLKIKLIILPLSTCTPFCSPRPKIRTNNFLIFKLKMLF